MPDPCAEAAVKGEAFRSVRDWVHDNQQWLFPPGATSYCYRHERECPLVGPEAIGNMEDMVDANSGPSPLRANCAGVSCLPWSAAGNQLREADPGEIPTLCGGLKGRSAPEGEKRMSSSWSALLTMRSRPLLLTWQTLTRWSP